MAVAFAFAVACSASQSKRKSESSVAPAAPQTHAQTYPTKWPSVLLACRKCQKKLKGTDLGKLKKLLKSQSKDSPTPHLLQVSCLKLCPKNGVTVCTPANLAQTPPRLTILYTPEDLATLTKESASPGKAKS